MASATDAVMRRLAPWLAERPAVALFLDYDGTLTPTAPRPEEAVLSAPMRQALEQAARAPHLDTVIVSGRAIADVQGLVSVPGLTYVGNHGFEIEGPGISFRHDDTERFRAALEAAAAELAALNVPGAWVERKGATLSYHVSGVAPADAARVERRAASVLQDRQLQVSVGKDVVDGRPPLDWHKGRAVLYVLARRYGTNWPATVRAVYIGDDTTDEDAFRSLRGVGRSIQVGSALPVSGSEADFRLPDPDAVLQLVCWLGSRATGYSSL